MPFETDEHGLPHKFKPQPLAMGLRIIALTSPECHHLPTKFYEKLTNSSEVNGGDRHTHTDRMETP